MALLDIFRKGLQKTKEEFVGRIDQIIKTFKPFDDDLFDELEEALISADAGVETTMFIVAALKDRIKKEKINDAEKVKEALKEIIISILKKENQALNVDKKPSIVLIVGVNGSGKTTSAGKLGYLLKSEGKSVMLAACDTFRAAASEQLTIWAKRANIDIVKHNEGADPSAVLYDALNSARTKKIDVLVVDTAGRLHNKKNLMDELNKIFRVIEKNMPEASLEVLLVLDATTGQNALIQAQEFSKAAKITGIVLTKLDGTAKGATVIALSQKMDIPVKFVGTGEQKEDFNPFSPEIFANALFD